MLNVYLSTLINNIVPLGFSADQHGLMAYNHHFTGLMASNSPLTEDLKALHKNVRAAWLVAAAAKHTINTRTNSMFSPRSTTPWLTRLLCARPNRSGRRCCASRLRSILQTGSI